MGEKRSWSHTMATSDARLLDQTPKAANPFLESYSRGPKRMKTFSEGKDISTMSWIANLHTESKYKKGKTPSNIVDYSDPFSLSNWLEGLDFGKYGSVTKDIEDLRERKEKMMGSLFEKFPLLPRAGLETCNFPKQQNEDIIDLEDDCIVVHAPGHSSTGHKQTDLHLQNHCSMSVVILDSDEEEDGDRIDASLGLLREVQHQPGNNELANVKMSWSSAAEANRKASYLYQEVVLKKPVDKKPIKDIIVKECGEISGARKEECPNGETVTKKKKGVYVGVQDDLMSENANRQTDTEDDGLSDIWREMTLALECSKDAPAESSSLEHTGGEGEEEECNHSFVLKDDLGYVCRVCGIIERGIDTIFDYQWIKGTRTTRTYMSESQTSKGREQTEVPLFSGREVSEDDLAITEISVHPRHRKQMKPHQLEGFNFLLRNLVTDKPGGCILAHAPGSGKTFMIISFMQSFLAKYPHARPLVVLPKGILATWRKEFQRWQVEDIPLYDFYSLKADNRYQQLEVLKNWVENRGILFLGYKQFSNIVCGSATSKIAAACHDILLKVPTILILDEGHTPRNENTDVLHSLAKVQTPRKVVLSGTLFQNHVKEVFNILNLVRPKFLKLDTSRAVVRRVLSKVQISGAKKFFKNGMESAFFDLVEATLQNDEDFRRKVTVIQDLREMTNNVLHYYKGDFLEELPGLVDFTVLLNLSTKQKSAVEKLKKLEKFKRSSVGSAVYMHPYLKEFSENATSGDKGVNFNDQRIDDLLEKMDMKDGVKTRFFFNILGLCESAGEKLLVFSQYLLPLKFLERLIVKTKGWSPGKEIFVISGDSSPEHREWSMERFNTSPDAKIFFGSIKACGEGISLVGASRLLILDVHLNPSVTRQAIGRAFRPGQERKVYIYRLVAADSPEEEDHKTCFRKELISKMWFEWSEFCGHQDFVMETVDVKDCGDVFLESPLLGEDVKVLYKR